LLTYRLLQARAQAEENIGAALATTVTDTVSGELSNFSHAASRLDRLPQALASAQMMVQRYSWLFAGYKPRLFNKAVPTNQSHASFNTSLQTLSRDGLKVIMCVSAIIVCLSFNSQPSVGEVAGQ
jgi:hypothetical protein